MIDTKWDVTETTDAVVVQTDLVKARVDLKTGAISFLDLNNNPVLRESDDGRDISPATQKGVEGTLVRQSFVLPPNEGIYGLGQHQQGIWNYRGQTVRLLQENREVGIPVILSSKGYSLLWDNPAVTDISVGASTKANGAGEDVMRWSSEVGKAIGLLLYLWTNLRGVDQQLSRPYRAGTFDAQMATGLLAM